MSQNDLIFLDSNFENWKTARALGLKKTIDPFVYYVVEQFLKPYDPNDEDILYGITDGPNDGGVDAIYFIVNRSNFVRDDTTVDHRAVTKARIVMFQVKNADDGFKMTEVDKIYFFVDDLLDLSRQAAKMATKYHPHLIQIMATIKQKYLQIASGFPTVNIEFYYVTRGDETKPDKKAQDAAARIKAKAKQHLSSAQSEYHFVNTQSLLLQVKKRPAKSRTIVWSEQPMQAKEGYVGVVKLPDYFTFITDDGELAEHIFEANVRGFQQDTPVNTQIRQSLAKPGPPNFWLLNNGITIVADKAPSAGHLRHELEDPQVVNGLQTSREIHNYFVKERPTKEDRSILVRVIPTVDDVVRDTIIKATNSQNKMEPASLRATDPIHHQIEDFFKQFDLYYDRRKGFYRDKGKPIDRIVTVMDVVKAVVAIVLQRPDDARARAGDYIKEDRQYDSIFGKDVLPLAVYLSAVKLVRRVEAFLETRPQLTRGDELNIKFYIAAIIVRQQTKGVDPSPEQIVSIDIDALDDKILKDAFDRVFIRYMNLGASDVAAKGPELLKRLKTSLKAKKKRR